MKLFDSRDENNECARRRRGTGLNQSDFAALVGVSESSVKKIESGRQGLSDAMRAKMDQALGCPDFEMVIENKVREYRKRLQKLYGVGN